MIREKLAHLTFALAALAGSLSAHAESGWNQLNMTQGVTHISREIYNLHMKIFWICVAIGVVVFGVMIWSIISYRKSKGAVPDVTLVHNTKVEIVWTIIPVVILVVMAVPAARARTTEASFSRIIVNVPCSAPLHAGARFFSGSQPAPPCTAPSARRAIRSRGRSRAATAAPGRVAPLL